MGQRRRPLRDRCAGAAESRLLPAQGRRQGQSNSDGPAQSQRRPLSHAYAPERQADAEVCVGQTNTTARHVENAWKRIQEEAAKLDSFLAWGGYSFPPPLILRFITVSVTSCWFSVLSLERSRSFAIRALRTITFRLSQKARQGVCHRLQQHPILSGKKLSLSTLSTPSSRDANFMETNTLERVPGSMTSSIAVTRASGEF